MTPILEKHLPLHSNSSRSSQLQEERRRDHYSHFILRLAFSATEDLRRRFSRLESMLFRLRYRLDDARERQEFVNSLDFAWEHVSEQEKIDLGSDLRAATGNIVKKGEEEGFFKVEFEKVPELVEQRRCLLKWGMAYIPMREQMTLVLAEFTARLDRNLDVSWISIFLNASLTQPSLLLAPCRSSTKTTASHLSSTTSPTPLQHHPPPTTTPLCPLR